MRSTQYLLTFVAFVLLAAGTVSATEYVAFSMKVAQQRMTKVPEERSSPAVFQLGGITKVIGLVYDREEGDVILVGEREPKRAPLTLDDVAIALRARFIHGKWPLVSIDPTQETARIEMQRVRFEGGIEHTQFGADLFDADYRLKKIALGLLAPGVARVPTHWGLEWEKAKRGVRRHSRIAARFWFYPVVPSVAVRENVVAIKGLKVGVFTEVLAAEVDGKKIANLSTFHDSTGDQFAKAISERFEELSQVHPSFARLQGLLELVALSKAIEEMEEQPDLSFWLKSYRIERVETTRQVKVLRRKETRESAEAGTKYRQFQEFSGGVHMRAIALRLKAGDVTALKEAVFKTRPRSNALSWSFIAREWLVPTSPEGLNAEEIAPLFTHASFLIEKKRYDDAIRLYGNILKLMPDWDTVYNSRGIAYYKKGEYDQALADLNKALELNPNFAEAYHNRGMVYSGKALYDQAIEDDTRALEINPNLAETYNNRGGDYRHKGQYDHALADLNKALEITPDFAAAYYNRGNVYRDKDLYDQAIADYTTALEVDPNDINVYVNRGTIYAKDKGLYDQAIADYTTALEIDPKSVDAYHNRGVAHSEKGQYDQAIADFNKALEIAPKASSTYSSRASVYSEKGQYKQAIADYTMALKITPRVFGAHYNKALLLEKVGRLREAVEAYKASLQYATPQYAAQVEYAEQRIRELGEKLEGRKRSVVTKR